MIKIAAYVFGPALYDAALAARVLIVLAGISACIAALIAGGGGGGDAGGGAGGVAGGGGGGSARLAADAVDHCR